MWLAALALVCLSIVDFSVLDTYTLLGQENQPAPMTAIGAIRALTPEAADRGRRVAVRGTITYINEREPAGIIVHDGSSGLFVHYGRKYFLKQPRIELHPGDVVEVDGYTTGEGFAPAVVPEGVRRVGQSALPPARHVPYAALLSGVFDCEYIETVGVGQRAWMSESGKTLFVDIAVEGGQVRAWFWDFSPAGSDAVHRRPREASRQRRHALQPGAAGARRLALRRTCRGRRSSTRARPTPGRSRSARSRASTPITRWISSTAACGCAEPSPATRVGQPTLVEDITMHSRSREVRHRIYVRDETSAALIETEQPFELAPGDVVDVAGFPVVSSTKPTLKNAVVRRVGHVAAAGGGHAAARDACWPPTTIRSSCGSTPCC